ncbi:MAG: hypothetical protein OXG58_08610 [Gemmatimonadetes bacterium]|nr:hypothetical protein [Gemmatimonadota bacterium]MCY3942266.1 hypothetical protein [Gemmatimonadota bacterium]
MYRSCIFCHRPLGDNEVIESFQIGRRLAFDAARGRLWVVCGRCERWNLSPLEERWGFVDPTYAQCAIVAAASGARLGGLGLPGPSGRYFIWTHQEEVSRGWE